MRTYAIVQALVIALVVAWSAGFAAKRLLPTASRRVQARIAGWMEGSDSPRLRRYGRSLQPVQAASGGCGSSGCSSCGACAPAAPIEARPLNFK